MQTLLAGLELWQSQILLLPTVPSWTHLLEGPALPLPCFWVCVATRVAQAQMKTNGGLSRSLPSEGDLLDLTTVPPREVPAAAP